MSDRPGRQRPPASPTGANAPTPPPPDPWTAPTISPEERARLRLEQRAQELRHGHWYVRVCARGHVIEHHRASLGAEAPIWNCPICGAAAQRELPEQTAQREFAAQTSPRALAARLADALGDWATTHLNASSWTQQSDAARAARMKADSSRGGQRSPFDL